MCRLHPLIGKLKHLEILSLDSNRLSDLPITLQFCQKLTTLSLVGNKFRFLPGVIFRMNNLTGLTVTKNPFDAPPNRSATAATEHSICVTSLQDLCIGAVFMNHIEYWKQESLAPLQYNMLEHLASTSYFCDICGLPIPNKDSVVNITNRVPIENHNIPFQLLACSAKCHRELLTHKKHLYNAESDTQEMNKKNGCYIM